MRQKDIDHYTYRVTWSPEDGEYLALCAEFPALARGVSALAWCERLGKLHGGTPRLPFRLSFRRQRHLFRKRKILQT